MDQLKALVTTIRALIISRPHNTTLQDLMKEYRELEGENIPFKKLGFKSLEDFLVDSKSFELRRQNGEVFVRAILKQESAHLVKMIAAQKKTKPKRSRGTSSVQIRPPFIRHPPGQYQAPHRPIPPPRPSYVAQRILSRPKSQHVETVTTRMPRLVPIEPLKPPTKATIPTAGTVPKPSVNHRIVRYEPPIVEKYTEAKSAPRIPERTVNARLVRQSSLPTPPDTPSPSPPIQVTVQNTQYSNGFSYSQATTRQSQHVSPVVEYTEPEISMTVTPEPEKFVLNKDTTTPIQDLDVYCRMCDYTEPHYTYSCVTFKGGDRMFQCRVTINAMTYCSYPEHCNSIDDAQRVAALIAINRLLVEEEIKKYPVCREDDVSIAGKLVQTLKEYPHGIVEMAIPEYFRKDYGLSLPENWANILYKYDHFTVEEIGGRNIVYTEEISTSRPMSDLMNDLEISEFEALELPWSLDKWTIQITNPVSTTEIYGRIVGEKYSKRLDALLVDIEMAMMTQTPPIVRCEDVQEGRIYLVTHSTIWCRVRVEAIDHENARHHCFCIDTGEQDVYTELYECSPEYLKLPHQAICFSLAFLENFEGNPYVKQHLDSIFLRSPRPHFLARVLTKQEEFEQHSNLESDMPINVVLMNADCPSLENNVNQVICRRYAMRHRHHSSSATALTLVKITHVSQSGDVFCQVKNIGLNYIQRLTDSLVNDQSKMKLRRSLESTDNDIRYLIVDRSTDKWYRATPEGPINLKDTTHRMFCIDFGFVLDVHVNDISQLEPLSQALCRFPALAIKCRLYGLQNMTPPIVSRIKGLLSEDSECIMKVMVSISAVPQVNCYMRHQGGTFFCINESIKIEEELVRQNDMNRNSPRSSSNSPDSENFARLKTSLPKIARTLSAFQKIEDFDVPPPESTFTLNVVHISNPTNFISQPCDGKIEVIFRELMAKLQKHCSGSIDKPLSMEQLEIGQAYAVFSEKDRRWHRGILDQMIDSQLMQVTLCDYVA
uniref:HTH OST-type domain-containing protein n=1 Tax=Lutzomyia longipalpis TaxID=7200 RepID=A0A1B0CFP4_LUTLO